MKDAPGRHNDIFDNEPIFYVVRRVNTFWNMGSIQVSRSSMFVFNTKNKSAVRSIYRTYLTMQMASVFKKSGEAFPHLSPARRNDSSRPSSINMFQWYSQEVDC